MYLYPSHVLNPSTIPGLFKVSGLSLGFPPVNKVSLPVLLTSLDNICRNCNCVCFCVCICIFLCICVCICICIFLCICVFLCLYSYFSLYCKSLPFFYFLTFEKADCSIFTLLVGRSVGWFVGWSVDVTINFFNI